MERDAGRSDPLGGPVDLSVIIVTYNSEAVIGDLLASLHLGLVGVPRHRVILVDNGSTDTTCDVIRSQYPQGTLLRHANVGYAAAINAAARQSEGSRHFLILNADVRLAPGCAQMLLTHADGDPTVGIAVPVITDPRDGSVMPSLRRKPTVLRAAGQACLGRRAERFAHLSERITARSVYERATVADWATGAALLISGPCLAAAGPWDESFFLYSEETEFALRARRLGWKLQLVPSARVWHVGGQAGEDPLLHTLLTVNRLRLYRRLHGRLATSAFWAMLVMNEVLRAPYRPTSRAASKQLLTRPGQPVLPRDARHPVDHAGSAGALVPWVSR